MKTNNHTPGPSYPDLYRRAFDYYSETGQYKMREAIALITEASDAGDPYALAIVRACNSFDDMLRALTTAATLLEACRGYFSYQTTQGDKFAPDAEWEKPIIEFLEKVKTII